MIIRQRGAHDKRRRTKRGQANPPAGPRCGVLPGLHSSRIFAMPTFWEKETVLVRVPSRSLPDGPITYRPADLGTGGAESKKVSLAGTSLRAARRRADARRP